MNLLSFTLADKEYAVNIDSVQEVRRVKKITPIPRSMDFIEGVVSLRGKIVPIISLRKKLGLPDIEHTILNRVIVTDINGHLLGVTVDSVIGVIKLDPANIELPDDMLKKTEYLSGVGKIGKRLILIIDIEKLLSGEEKSDITTIHKKVEVRKKE
ncbi:MAG: chemotaxis protein CheW [Candidatus Omnitrophica bacterium]|nr:chemotaxis protein CheW [Candidatus Omnitrophota bacterium]